MAKTAPPDVPKYFGVVLRRHRKHAGISQEELAGRSDIDRTFVYRMEAGVRQPTVTTVLALAEALEISPGILLDETLAAVRKAQRRVKS